MDHRLASLVGRTMSSPPSPLKATHSSTGLIASLKYLTLSSSSATPAADKIFGTVELVEAILGELSLKDLMVAMRTCVSFCAIIKTSTIVMRDKYWLSLKLGPDRADKSTATVSITGPEAVRKQKGSVVYPHVVTAPLFEIYASFTVSETFGKDEFTIEMGNHSDDREDATGARAADGRMHLVYWVSKCPCEEDTTIKVRSSNSTELWRRVPLTDAPGGVEGFLGSSRGFKLGSKLFDQGSTLGDLYIWFRDQVATSGELPCDHTGPWHLIPGPVLANVAG